MTGESGGGDRPDGAMGAVWRGLAWDVCPDPLLTIDLSNGLILDANPAALRLWARPASALIGAGLESLMDAASHWRVSQALSAPTAPDRPLAALRLGAGDPEAPLADLQIHAADDLWRRLLRFTLRGQATEDSTLRLNWALEAYARSSSALIHFDNIDSLVLRVCEAIVGRDRYALAGVGLAQDDEAKSVRFTAGAGRAIDYFSGLEISWSADRPSGLGPTGQAIRDGEARILRDMQRDPNFAFWRDRAARFGLRSSVTVPFDRPGQGRGVLIVFAARANAFGDAELDLFKELARELSFALAVDANRKQLALAEASRRAVEESLARALRDYRMLADNLADIIVHIDRRSRIQYVSPSCAHLGWRAEDLIGRSIIELVHPDDRRQLQRQVRQLRDPQSQSPDDDRDMRVRRADGGWVWVEGNPQALLDPDGRPAGAVTLIRDVTQRRALEEQLREKRRDAEAAAVAKTQFLANMSHEIRTPLTAIIGFAGLLESTDAIPPMARRYVSRIATSSQDLLAIVNDVLDFSKIEAGQIDLDPTALDCRPFLTETLDLVRTQAAAKGVALELALDDSLPGAIKVDGGRLRQVVLNLLSNAVKFTAAGQVRLEAAYMASEQRLHVAVRDTGVGISADQIPRLFQRFSQIDASNTRQYGGSGLGLAISKGLVERMGGVIGVDSTPGLGSRFWFTIEAPLAGQTIGRDDGQAGARPKGALRILVVDDVPVNRELVGAILAPFDLELVEASGGAEAVDLAKASRFDLVLMDLQMPGMDGLAATAAIRAQADLNARTPILALSANVLPVQVEACGRAGMNDHIGKPINPKELLDKISRWTAVGVT